MATFHAPPWCPPPLTFFTLLMMTGASSFALIPPPHVSTRGPGYQNDVNAHLTLRIVGIQMLRIMSAAFSAIMMTGALVLPLVIVGITLASTTRKPSTPRRRN